MKDIDAEFRAGREVTVAEVQEAIRGMTAHDAPLITADPPVQVEVWDARTGAWYPGQVTHWRADMVNVKYSRGPGLTHLEWLPAEAVRRNG